MLHYPTLPAHNKRWCGKFFSFFAFARHAFLHVLFLQKWDKPAPSIPESWPAHETSWLKNVEMLKIINVIFCTCSPSSQNLGFIFFTSALPLWCLEMDLFGFKRKLKFSGHHKIWASKVFRRILKLTFTNLPMQLKLLNLFFRIAQEPETQDCGLSFLNWICVPSPYPFKRFLDS